MAKADTKNGFTQIANTLLEKICSSSLTQNETRVLLAMIRLSYGWRQKDTGDRAGAGELQKITGLFNNQIFLSIKSLKKKRIILVEKGKQNKYSINTQLSEWDIVTNHYQSQNVA